MTYEVDEDSELRPAGDGGFDASVSARWSLRRGISGGYLMGLGVRAMAQVSDKPDPMSVTAHFLRTVEPGEARVDVDVIRAGRVLSTVEARLRQDGRERVRLLSTFGDLVAAEGPSVAMQPAPHLPDPDICLRADDLFGGRSSGVPLGERVDLRLLPEAANWGRDGEPRRGVIEGWVGFADGRPPDLEGIVTLVDVCPPAVWELGFHQGLATIELTAYLRGRPAPGWLRFRTTTRYVVDGYVEQQVDLWDDVGQIVAQGSQLAVVFVPRGVSR